MNWKTIAPLTLATLIALAAPPAANAQSNAIDVRDDGSVSAFDKTYESLEAYHHSAEFIASGRRCGTHEPPIIFAATPADCSLSQTSIDGDYDPAAGQEFVIQVVVHVLSEGGTGDLAESLVTSQIDILNEDFNALAGTPGAPGANGKISFILATSDPDGNPTNGINRVAQYFNNPDAATAVAWDPNRYLNIYSANLGGGVLGYVQAFPQQIAGNSNDGVWTRYTSVGRNSPGGGVFNQGRTVTHEVGHYMGLRHIWGDESTCNNQYDSGDLVMDTVPSTGPAFGCETNNDTCGAGNNVENYMDYSDDLCMDNFTPEQINRMRCVMVHYRPLLFNALPTAEFEYTVGTPPSELVIAFTDTSVDTDGTVVAWEWDFGDGQTSTEQNPSNTYADFGNFDVTLTVTDDRGVKASVTEAITVNIAPNAGFDFDADGVSVVFTDTSTDANGTIASWEWDFGDSNVSQTQSPTHTFAAIGTYTVTLSVTDDLGSKTSTSLVLDLALIEQEQADAAGCGCQSSGSGGPLGLLLVIGLALGLGRRSRRSTKQS